MSSSKTPLYIGLGLVGVVLLVGAAFLAGRLLNRPQGFTTSYGGPGGVPFGGGPMGGAPGNSDVMTFKLNVEPAPELPKLPPEATGVFTRHADNSVFIDTSAMGLALEGGNPSSNSGTTTVEVVISEKTLVYRETTQLDPAKPPSADTAIQQTVALGDVEEIVANTTVVVWGRRTGDRVSADVVLYSQPVFYKAPGP